jgi:chemotaxis protein methyltransferase CheR
MAICCEEMRRQKPDFSYEIVGTDISTEVLAQAQVGRYGGSAVAAFRAADPLLFERYNAEGSAERFMLPAPVRSRMAFSPHNLLAKSPWQEQFDVVFLRNVLIYFNAEDTLRIVRNIAPALRARGVLVIGESESLTSVDVPFQFVQPQVYERTSG